MSNMDLDNLYRQVIMAHARQPHHYHPIDEDLPYQARKYNPSCGDIIQLSADVSDGKISDVAFDGNGCAISMASASMMTDAIAGGSIDDAKQLSAAFSAMFTDEKAPDPALGDLEVLAGVRQFPTRIKCATLAWHALDDLLDEAERSQ
ncbi:SUF system NifU family Fe-S cluster assembly protein [Lactobacillaceae bacterium L1_55_11]|nr:SUF system NifU family Fe-S cluster assembly protein [Lactobacillaceae bacterium L1_55_11]